MITLVTGANKGIGLQVVKKLSKSMTILLGSRDLKRGSLAKDEILKYNAKAVVDVVQLDMDDVKSMQDVQKYISREYGVLDVLINNAAIFEEGCPSKISQESLTRQINTNLIGPWFLTQYLIELLQKSKDPRIINVSSGAGQTENLTSSHAGYRVSKLGLSGFTKMLASEYPDMSINVMCPGWVRTDMGGSDADRSVEEGADTIVWLASMQKPPTGKLFRDREEIDW